VKKNIATPLTRTYALKRAASDTAENPTLKQAKSSWETRLEKRGYTTALPQLARGYSLNDSQDIYGRGVSLSRDSSTERASGSTASTILSAEVYTASQEIESEISPLSNSDIAQQNGWKAIRIARENVSDVPEFSAIALDKKDLVYAPTHFNDITKRTHHRATGYEFDNKACRPKGMEDWITRGRISTDFVSGDYFIVCDGHGASLPSDTENASQMVARFVANNVSVFLEKFLKSTEGDINKALLRAVKMTDAIMDPESGLVDRHGVIGLPESVRCGTTLTIAFIPDTNAGQQKKIHIANVGDTRAVLCSDGEGDQVTIDHDMATLRDKDKELIENAGLEIKRDRVFAPHFGGLAMYRSMGNFDHAGAETANGHRGGLSSTPDIFEINVIDEDTHLIIACDGVWDVMSNDDAAEIVGVSEDKKKNPAKSLVDVAKKSYTRDNVSAIVVDLRLN